jgi:hypothetical protein
MKKLIALACLGFAVAASAPAFAGPQQEKMKTCNKEAKGLKGEERKAFMSKCLSKNGVAKVDAAKAAKPAAVSGVAAAPAVGKKHGAAAPTSAVAATAANNAAASGKQQTKMKTCNEQVKTKNLKGEERRKFMATCLKA